VKKDEIRNNWKSRLIVLTKDSLYYFDSPVCFCFSTYPFNFFATKKKIRPSSWQDPGKA